MAGDWPRYRSFKKKEENDWPERIGAERGLRILGRFGPLGFAKFWPEIERIMLAGFARKNGVGW